MLGPQRRGVYYKGTGLPSLSPICPCTGIYVKGRLWPETQGPRCSDGWPLVSIEHRSRFYCSVARPLGRGPGIHVRLKRKLQTGQRSCKKFREKLKKAATCSANSIRSRTLTQIGRAPQPAVRQGRPPHTTPHIELLVSVSVAVVCALTVPCAHLMPTSPVDLAGSFKQSTVWLS